MKTTHLVRMKKLAKKPRRQEPLFTKYMSPAVAHTVFVHKPNGNVVCCDLRLASKVILKK